MRKKLVKIGSSWGITIPSTLLDLMGIEPEKSRELELNFDGKSIIITPVKED